MAQSGAKKKVLIAITKSNFGGAQRYVYDIARLLPTQGFEVVVAHGGRGILAEKLQHTGVRTIQIQGLERDVRFASDISAFVSLLRILKSERPDVVHLNSSKMGLMGALAARLCGIPRIIFTAHGWPFNENRSILARTVLRMLARITVSLSHHIIAVSEAVARAIDPQHHMRKVSIIHNGVEEEKYLSRNDARHSLAPSHSTDELWFGTIAELHPVKGLSYALEAFRRHMKTHPHSRYVIIGDGEERARLLEQAKVAGLESRVTFCGFRDNASQYLHAFDVFVLPSLSEAISFAVLEAGRAGLPVIATNVGGIPEIIASSEQGMLVPSCDAQALANAFDKMANNADYRQSTATNLTSRVKTLFSLNTMFEKTEALY